MAKGSTEHQTWARLGAQTRLQQIERERAAILKAFPGLRTGSQPAMAIGGDKRKRVFSAAARRRMSAGMRKFWAKRKAAAKAKAA